MSTKNHSYKKFAKGAYFLVLGNFVNLGFGAIFWLILAKIAEPTIIGQAMVVTGFATTIVGFSGYGIQIAISKYMSEYNAKDRPNTARRVLKQGLRASLIMSGVMAVAISLLSGQIATIAYQDSSLALLLVFTIATFLPSQTVIAALLGAFQGVHNMKYVTIVELIFQLSRMAVAVLAVLYGLDVFGILLGFALSSFIALAVCYFYLLPRAIPKTGETQQTADEKKDNQEIVNFTGLNYFTVGVKTTANQLGVLVLGTQSFELAAFYGLAYLISKIVATFSHSVGQALLPTAAEERVKGNKIEIVKMVNTAVRISLLIGGFGFIVLMMDPHFFLTLISEHYVTAGMGLRLLAISAIINAIAFVLTSLLNASSRAKHVAINGLISSAAIIALTFVLVPINGIEGAAIAMIIGQSVSAILAFGVLRSKEGITISVKSVIKPFIAISSALAVGYLFVLLNHTLIGIILAIGSYTAFSFIYRATTKKEVGKLIRIVIPRRTASTNTTTAAQSTTK